ncbi:hypothetical protein [Methylobacterium thuringiense]|uniref:Uncharacterized protein n=1 Tax=Methylobacterium thuringiense TaxID=1003091 RepID=A0ABQ4TGB7_9HYPH|nr:hypothetical protein [Methylobacterium thuringiense]GJE53814.1 hypothetical protein EKPJFOCH_0282 [Methylobacterium thuringiense]
MKLALAPTAATTLAQPSVGIFWRIGDYLLVERTPLAQAETYGDCLTHAGGHYERWDVWQALGAKQLRAEGYPSEIACSEYDHWPRGRIVYERPAGRFVIYADRRLQRPEFIAQLRETCGLLDAVSVVRGDPHYR